MAMAWPYGIADPHLYAYLAAAAASYPYGISSTNSNPFNLYTQMGIQRPAVTFDTRHRTKSSNNKNTIQTYKKISKTDSTKKRVNSFARQE
jgi:hypothetical protein